MTTLFLLATFGFQAPPETGRSVPPTGPRIPPPIPQPPVNQPGTQSPAPVQPPAASLTPALPAPPQPVIRHVFLRQHDVNVDGRLEPAELERRYARHFAQADLNGDGFLDGSELLMDRHNLGRAARKLDGLDLDQDGRLRLKGDRRGPPITDVARGVLDIIDAARAGNINVPGVQISVSQGNPLVPPPASELDAPSALPTRPASPAIPMPPDVPSPPMRSATPVVPPGQGAPPQTAKKGDDLPNADQIIVNLDRDGDGLLNETEAVDQLAKNFKTLDKNRDGKLSKDEIDRGLRLARMFGIKPMQAPQTYKNAAAPKAQNAPK